MQLARLGDRELPIGSLAVRPGGGIRCPNRGLNDRREVELRDNVDIYFVLLGLPPGRRPPDHYTLLGLPPLTDSPRQINTAVERQMAKLTPLLLSPQGRRVQRMIGEVLEARDVLTSESRKRAYDADLVSGVEPKGSAKTRETDVRAGAKAAAPVAPKPAPANRAKPNVAPRKAAAPKPTPIDVEAMLPPPAIEPVRAPAMQPVALPVQPPEPAPVANPEPAAAEPEPIPIVPTPSPFAQVAQHRFAPTAKDTSLSELALDILQPRTSSDEPDFGPFDASLPAPFAATAPSPNPIFEPIVEPVARNVPTPRPDSPFTPYDHPVESPLPTAAAVAEDEWPRPADDGGLNRVSRASGVVVPRRQVGAHVILIAVAAAVGGAGIVACLAVIANQRPTARTAEVSNTAATSRAAKDSPAEKATPQSQTSAGTKPPPIAPKEPAGIPVTPAAPPVNEMPINSMPPATEPITATPPKTDPPKPVPIAPAPEAAPNPTPTPAAAPAGVPAGDPKEVQAVTAALTTARTALEKRDMEEARKALDLALLEATNPNLIAKIENERTLHHYIDGFWGAVRERIKGLQGGEELAVGKQVVIVVERRGDRIIIRDRGANRTVGPRDMPAPIAAALAESWLKKEDPNSAVFLGAFWSVDAKGDEKRGRQILEDAKKNGAEAAAGVLEALGPGKQTPK